MWAAEPAAEEPRANYRGSDEARPRKRRVRPSGPRIPASAASRQATRGGGTKYEELPGTYNADELECRSLKADIVAAIA